MTLAWILVPDKLLRRFQKTLIAWNIHTEHGVLHGMVRRTKTIAWAPVISNNCRLLRILRRFLDFASVFAPGATDLLFTEYIKICPVALSSISEVSLARQWMSHLVNICRLVLHFFLILSLCPQRDELRSNERKGGAVKKKIKKWSLLSSKLYKYYYTVSLYFIILFPYYLYCWYLSWREIILCLNSKFIT